MIKLVSICGPTAVGKTRIAIEVCKAFNAEVVSCDSMQIYKGMDIGSAKPTPAEQEEVKHHLIDIVDPKDEFTVFDYSILAREKIDELSGNGILPLITGGTGLYLDSIIYNMDFAAAPPDLSRREKYYKLAEEEGAETLHNILKELDPETAERIHPNNIKRVVRAIESIEEGISIEDFSSNLERRPEYDACLIGLMRDREELYNRINERVDIMMAEGLLDEVKTLMEYGLDESYMSMKGIGYKELISYFKGQTTLDEAINSIKTNSRHYAKRQMTWLRKYGDYEENPAGVKWFNITEFGGEDNTFTEIKKWLAERL